MKRSSGPGLLERAKRAKGARGEIERAGSKPTLLISSDSPVAKGQDGNLYYPPAPSSTRTGGLKIMRMKPSGETSVLATLPDTDTGPLPHVNGIATGPENSIYYSENDVIRKIAANGEISEETCRMGSALRELLSLRRIGLRYKRIIEEVIGERRRCKGEH